MSISEPFIRRPVATTLLKTNLSHLAEHVALVLVPIAGLYRLLPDPLPSQ